MGVRGQTITQSQLASQVPTNILSYHDLVATCEIISVTSPPGACRFPFTLTLVLALVLLRVCVQKLLLVLARVLVPVLHFVLVLIPVLVLVPVSFSSWAFVGGCCRAFALTSSPAMTRRLGSLR